VLTSGYDPAMASLHDPTPTDPPPAAGPGATGIAVLAVLVMGEADYTAIRPS